MVVAVVLGLHLDLVVIRAEVLRASCTVDSYFQKMLVHLQEDRLDN